MVILVLVVLIGGVVAGVMLKDKVMPLVSN